LKIATSTLHCRIVGLTKLEQEAEIPFAEFNYVLMRSVLIILNGTSLNNAEFKTRARMLYLIKNIEERQLGVLDLVFY
jgi:hypothetical protein